MDLSFVNNTITIYKYEPFGFRFPRPVDASFSSIASVTSGLPISLFTPPSIGTLVTTDISFSSTGYNGSTALGELFVLNAYDSTGSNILYRSSNTVNIFAGRFVTPTCNTTYTFFKNEAITPVLFTSFINLSGILTSPTLPPGLVFVSNDICSAFLQGTPLIEFPTCNYQIIGRDSGKIVTTRVNIGVQPERVQLNLSGSSIVNLTVGSAITPRTVTAKYPLQSPSNLAYTWSGLPDGLGFVDSSSSPVVTPFFPTDGSATITLVGTPTIAAATAFANAGITSNNVTLRATRVSSPNISNTNTFTFVFQPTVLFDSVTVPPLFTNVPVPGGISFRAKTYFGSDASITTIFSPDLITDLSLIFISNQQRADLSGTPTTPFSGTFTVTASNANGLTRDITPSLNISNDTVTFSIVPTDACSTFILSRPIELIKEGYYKYPIQFSATAASGNPITYSASGISLTGLSLSTTSNIATLVGTPDVSRSLTNLVVTATATATGADASTSVLYSIIDDVFTFSTPTVDQLTFVQNRPIIPVQFSATTLSGRTINYYSAANLPTGLSMSATGVLSGTVTATNLTGTFTVFANTGFRIGSQTYSYSIIPDALILYTDSPQYAVSPGGNVDIPIRSISFSGRSASNYAFGDLSANYGFSIGSTNGLISGTLIDGIPPGTLLPISSNFYVSAQVTNIDASLNANISTINPIVNRSFLSAKNSTQVVAAATYDLSNYNPASPFTIPNTAPGSLVGSASVNLGSFNTYVASSPTYLQIFAPNNFPNQTGGIHLPSIANIRSIETWVRLPSLENYGQVFIDFRSGLANGFMIASAGGANNGTGVLGATLYINGSASTITSSTNIGQLITGEWRQVVITFPFAFTDDTTFFMRFNDPNPALAFVQGMPLQVGEISVYDTPLADGDVRALFNSKSTRYGVAPGPSITLYRSDDSYTNWTRIPSGIVRDTPTTQIDTLPFVYRYESVDSSSNVFFVGSTGNSFAWSMDGISFTQYNYTTGTTNFGGSSVLNIPNTSTWWVVGTQLSNLNYEPVVYSSTTNGIAWTQWATVPGFITRDSNRGFRTLLPYVDGNAYFMSGAEFVYKDGVYLLGGYGNMTPNTSILRSTDASSWTPSAGSFLGDIAFISTDVSGMWIASGSDQFPWNTATQSSGYTGVPTPTMKYSTDQGQTWLDASSAFNYHGYDVVYGCNTWLATGVDASGSGSGGSFYTHQLRYSIDGSGDWIVSDIPGLGLTFSNAQKSLYPLNIGRPVFTGSNWQVMITDSSGDIRVYSHDTSSSFASNWSASSVISTIADSPRRMLPAEYIRSGTPTTSIISFASATGGPTVISPAAREFLVYQYVPLDPIVIELSGSGNLYALVIDDDLPAGLVYNPVTRTISGTPVQLGEDAVRVFVQDDTGYFSFVLIFRVVLPFFLRRQTSASAYTSYLRQYTLVNAAQNSRDNVVYPTQERSLGEFAAPEAPDVSSAVVTCPAICR
jgi:hypothetical protein